MFRNVISRKRDSRTTVQRLLICVGLAQARPNEMVSILEHCHQYVQTVNDGGAETYSPIPFFGDQLTAVRELTAKKTRVTSQGNSAFKGACSILCGLVYKSEFY